MNERFSISFDCHRVYGFVRYSHRLRMRGLAVKMWDRDHLSEAETGAMPERLSAYIQGSLGGSMYRTTMYFRRVYTRKGTVTE